MSLWPIGSYFPDQDVPQKPADVAVVIPTIMRASLREAIASIYGQASAGRVQIMIGVDRRLGSSEDLDGLFAERPAGVSILTVNLPYSTSAHHGGVHTALDGGSLRSTLALMANSRRIAFLDDDNTYLPPHLAGLVAALEGKAWAFSQRLLVDADSGADLGVDRWDSVGPNLGRFAAEGGFVDTNCLMIDKVKAGHLLGYWAESGAGETGWKADRNFFRALSALAYGQVEQATVRYKLWPNHVLRPLVSPSA